jgi:hypothetical protein
MQRFRAHAASAALPRIRVDSAAATDVNPQPARQCPLAAALPERAQGIALLLFNRGAPPANSSASNRAAPSC